MSLFLLCLTISSSIPLYCLRRKKYDISLLQMIIIYVVVATVGAIGACIGAYMSGERLSSVRLYGLIIFISIVLLILSYIMKINIGKMGDFISVPTMVVCFSAKINCLIQGCCSGFVICETQSGDTVKFPSALFEMILWAMLTVFLIILEKRKDSINLLWPIMVIWFGLFRFVASCFREYEKDFLEMLPGVSGGKFWSIMTLIIGLIYMYLLLKRNLNRKPQFAKFMYAIFGMEI